MAKYVNSPESEIYHKSNELYGIFFAKKSIVKEDRCFLVEGYTDVISMHQNGIENVVASSGTSLTPGQIRMIHRFTDNVTVIYDGDAAGIKASLRGIDLLLEEGLNIKVLLLPDGEDPDSFAQKHNSADFIAFVEKNSVDFIRFKTGILLEDAGNDPVKRAGLIIDIVKSIAIIPNQVIRAEYVKECSMLLQVDEAMLYHEINKLKKAEQGKAQTNTPQPQAQAEQPDNAAQAPLSQTPQTGIYVQEERSILQTLIRYGKMDMQHPDLKKQAPEPIITADFIYEEINRDGISFSTPVHQQILKEYETHYQEADFNAEKHFLYHPNPAIAQLTADLITEKYTLSKIHAKIKEVKTDADKLHELVPRVMYEFKNRLVLDMIKEKLFLLKEASETKNYTLADEIMQELKMLDEVKQKLAKELGTRVITKF
jgi:DNA primase